MRDYWIAHRDEQQIEAEAYGLQDSAESFARKVRAECAETLQRIDRLIVSGSYEQERARLAAQIPSGAMSAPPEITPRIQAAFDAFDNYTAGKNSPDPDQRARFERFGLAAGLATMELHEIVPFIAALEPAKRKQGRRRHLLPWESCRTEMGWIRQSVYSGHSIPKAARLAAEKTRRAGIENRAKTLERLYRQKLKLRDIN
ncbi:MAG: hypothetical protein HLUCCA04_03200 [Oceanicaulis sp. HLUCCA04]|nr:MAG: hypothetical protein HLUCCA04_03200 [Oceanicaulis sp. HLUCCA04]